MPYLVGQKSVIIVDKLMKIAGHLVMVVLIKGYWKNLISKIVFMSISDDYNATSTHDKANLITGTYLCT